MKPPARFVDLTEACPEEIALTASEAIELRNLGMKLASQKGRYGEDLGDNAERNMIDLQLVSDSKYLVTVRNAVGAIALGDLQLLVRPKIPLRHLIYLLEMAKELPLRKSEEIGVLSEETSFHEVVVRWFLQACETLIKIGLDRDYEPEIEDLPFARGRILVIPTAQSFLTGRHRIRCEYDTFTEDESLNRVLKAAALDVLRSPSLHNELRARGRVIYEQLDACGELRPGDKEVVPDLRRHHYRDAHQLALMIIASGGIALSPGSRPMWTFLVPTPRGVERGLRELLKKRLPGWQIDTDIRKLQSNRNRQLEPDIVFDNGYAVADIKYKISKSGDIERPDLNQVTAFATGYGATRAAVIAFGPPVTGEQVQIGQVSVRAIVWNDKNLDPDASARQVVAEVADWLTDSPRIFAET